MCKSYTAHNRLLLNCKSNVVRSSEVKVGSACRVIRRRSGLFPVDLDFFTHSLTHSLTQLTHSHDTSSTTKTPIINHGNRHPP